MSLSDSKTKLISGASDSDLEKAVKIINNGGKISLSKSDRVSIAYKAKSSGVKQAAGSDPKKAAYLSELMQGHGTDFLEDVLKAYEYSKTPARFSSFHHPIGSIPYLEYMEKRGFNRPHKLSCARNSNSYVALLKDGLQSIAKTIYHDLNSGLKNNDYLQDEWAEILRKSVGQLEKCGFKCTGLKGKIDKLAWFVGGNSGQIRALQKKLNELGMQGKSGKLLEDGVYGQETLTAWDNFLDKLATGAMPILAWVDPLQTNRTTGQSSVRMDSGPIQSSSFDR